MLDFILIIKALVLNCYALLQQRDMDILNLRGLYRSRQNLILLRTRCNIQLGAFIDQLFPELNHFFRLGLHINTSYQLLKLLSSPTDVKGLHLTYLSNQLLKASRGKYTKEDAIRLKELAKTSVGINSPTLPMQIKHTIAQIELFNEQFDEVKASLAAIMKRIDSPIMTIPGIGFVNGAMILSSIGDITKLPHHSKLLAYAGLTLP